MKWFKHLSDSHESETIDKLREIDMFRDSFSAVGRWWTLLEIVADKMDDSDRCHVEFSIAKWRRLLDLSPQKLRNFVVILTKVCQIEATFTPKSMRIRIPNLLKYRDNYTNYFQVTTKKLKTIDIEKDIDKKRNHEDVIKKLAKTGEKSRVERASKISKKFVVTKKMRAWFFDKQRGGIDIEIETEKFSCYHESKGSLMKNWEGAWRGWMARAEEYKSRTSIKTRQAVDPPWLKQLEADDPTLTKN